MKCHRCYAFLIFTVLAFLAACEESPRVSLVEGTGEVNLVLLYQHTPGARLLGGKTVVARSLAGVAQANKGKVYFITPLGYATTVARKTINLAVILKGSSIEQVDSLKRSVETTTFLRFFNLAEGYLATARGLSTDLTGQALLALSFEKRSKNFSRLSPSAKDSTLLNEEKTFLSKTPSTILESNYVISGGKYHTIRFIGLTSVGHWSQVKKSGHYHRSLTRVDKLSMMVGTLQSPETLAETIF